MIVILPSSFGFNTEFVGIRTWAADSRCRRCASAPHLPWAGATAIAAHPGNRTGRNRTSPRTEINDEPNAP
jgi:hypothetical protein